MAAEVERVLEGRDPTYAELGQLQYVRWGFDEAMLTLRFELDLLPHPIVPMPRISLGLPQGLRMKVRGREPAA